MIYGYLLRVTEKRVGTTSTYRAQAWRIVIATGADMIRAPYPRCESDARARAKELGITLLERGMSEDQYEALQRWAEHYGKQWRRHLRAAWEGGQIPFKLRADEALLMMVRDWFGPDWLTGFKLTKE